MSFLGNLFNTELKDKVKSLEIEVKTIRVNFGMLLDEYRLHIKHLHDPYKKVMTKAEEVKKETRKRGRRRKDNK